MNNKRPFNSGMFKAVLVLMFLTVSTISIQAQTKKVVIGYIGGFKGLANIDVVDAAKLTHINYAFVDIKDNRAWLHREATDTINLRRLVELKKKNPALKVLISIGGWTWSGKFSDAVLSDTSRQGFAASAVAILSRFNLDGIDIDWEYPGRPGYDGNVYRPEDKQNYTLMFKEIRRQLDDLQKQTGKKYLITTAAGGFKNFLDHTEMGIAQQYLDYINLMTYDLTAGKLAAHHTALYPSNAYSVHNDADDAVKNFENAGVPSSKLVMGIAFYSHTLNLKEGAKGLGDSIVMREKNLGYTSIKDSLLKVPGYKVHRDKDAKADYIFNPANHEFITYDDEYSVKQKCKYVLKNDMGGVMFWEYNDDLKEYLLNEINADLK